MPEIRTKTTGGSEERSRLAFWPEELVFRRQDLAVAVRPVERQTDTVPHRHAFTELVIVTGGRATHLLETGTQPLAAGDVFVIGTRGSHGYGNTRRFRLINIFFRTAFLAELPAELRREPGFRRLFGEAVDEAPAGGKRGAVTDRVRLPSSRRGPLLNLVRALADEGRHPQSDTPLLIRTLAVELLVRLSRLAAGNRAGRQGGTEPQAGVDRLVHAMDRHTEKPLPNLAAMAAEARMSVRSLLRHFKTETGTSPLQYRLRLRLAEACRQLRETDAPVGEIAARCGFPDGNYFSRQFHRVTGISPRVFRQRHAAATFPAAERPTEEPAFGE